MTIGYPILQILFSSPVILIPVSCESRSSQACFVIITTVPVCRILGTVLFCILIGVTTSKTYWFSLSQLINM
jgi:hypothetical protein